MVKSKKRKFKRKKAGGAFTERGRLRERKSKALHLLGLGKSADENEIKKAYHKMSLKHHPDRNPHQKEAATIKFREINEAYKFLNKFDELLEKTEPSHKFFETIFHDQMQPYYDIYNYFRGSREPHFWVKRFQQEIDDRRLKKSAQHDEKSLPALNEDGLIQLTLFDLDGSKEEIKVNINPNSTVADLCKLYLMQKGWNVDDNPDLTFAHAFSDHPRMDLLDYQKKLSSYDIKNGSDVLIFCNKNVMRGHNDDLREKKQKESEEKSRSSPSDQQPSSTETNPSPSKKSWFEKFMSYFRYSNDPPKVKESYYKRFLNSLRNIRGYFNRTQATGGYQKLKRTRTLKALK